METIGDTWVPLQSATEGFPPVPDQTEVVALHPFDDRSADSDHSPVEPESPLLHDLLSISAQKTRLSPPPIDLEAVPPIPP